jgi:signal transduction histidine kinase
MRLAQDVKLVVKLADAPMMANIDRSQFETALINLTVNARDALPEGGEVTVTIAPENEESIDGHSLDNGIGMEQHVLDRAEPFFTTKPVGKGTGLGLSQVYGFASQIGGNLMLRSAPGEGTRAVITLPRIT